MAEILRVLSWGCGVQSTALAVMSALGDMERLDVIIHADTQWERRATIEVRDFYTEWLRERGFRVEIVTGGDIRKSGAEDHIHIPFWTESGGPLRRQCTSEFKILPQRRRIREILGFHPSKAPAPKPGSVEKWIGFSLDEWGRMKDSGVKFVVNRFPLIERKITRNDCVRYLEDRGLPVPVKSACICCPYRRASEWLEMKESDSAEFGEAVAFDEHNRNNPLAESEGSTADQLFVYQPGPLVDADLAADAKKERQGVQLPLLICNGDSCWT